MSADDGVVASIRFLRATPERWVEVNPVLKSGMPGYEIGTGRFKIGDGINRWTELDYQGGAADVADLGDLEDLDTDNKDNLVDAVNEVYSLLQFSVPLRTLYSNAKAG